MPLGEMVVKPSLDIPNGMPLGEMVVKPSVDIPNGMPFGEMVVKYIIPIYLGITPLTSSGLSDGTSRDIRGRQDVDF